MRIALCVDNRNGFSFNHRRLSRDRAQQENLMALCAGEPLWLASCSLPLFRWAGDQVRVFGALPAASHGLFFFEDRLPPPEWASEIVLYRWNPGLSSGHSFHLGFIRIHLGGDYRVSRKLPSSHHPKHLCAKREKTMTKRRNQKKIKSSQAMALLLLALVGSALYRYAVPASTASIQDIPAYNGSPYVTISDNVPTFTEQDWTTDSYEIYGRSGCSGPLHQSGGLHRSGFDAL